MIVLRATRRFDPWLYLRGGLVLVAVALADLAVTLTVWWETHKPGSATAVAGWTIQVPVGSFGGLPEDRNVLFDDESLATTGADRLWDRVALLGVLAVLAVVVSLLLRTRRDFTRGNLYVLAGASAVVVLALLPFGGFFFRHLVGSIGWFGYGPS